MGIQEIVDHIAVTVSRPALLEDRNQRAVVYSPQSGAIDEVRQATILQRYAGPAVSSWLHTLGLAKARMPVRTPLNRDLQMLPRVCIPIWQLDVPLGYLWFIESPDVMTERDVEIASGLGSELAQEWHRSRVNQDFESTRTAASVRDLLLGSGDAIRRAASDLAESGGFPSGSAADVLVVRPVLGLGGDGCGQLKDRLDRVVNAAGQTTGAYRCLTLTRPDHAALVLPVGDGAGAERRIEEMAGRLSAAAERALAKIPSVEKVIVSSGGIRNLLDQAQDSYLDACRAAQVAVSFGLGKPVVHWDQLGVYRGLYAIANSGVQPADMQAGFAKLLQEKDGDALLDTLECYLNLGGHVQEAATRLNLHRTSLYYRLDRIQKITGIDLQDGVQRLGLHLAVLLERMKPDGTRV